jgi:hypothetical protein
MFVRFHMTPCKDTFQNLLDMELPLLVAHKVEYEHQSFLRKQLQPSEKSVSLH